MGFGKDDDTVALVAADVARQADADAAAAASDEAPLPTFEMAIELTKKNVDAAIDIWARLLEKGVAELGDTAPSLAPLYYRYGDALLRKVEESDDLFGGSDAAGAGASGDDGDDDLGADDEPPAENEDLALAWDMIEVSRSLFEADGLLAQEGLATALLRLGDLQKLNGNLGAAIGDYEKCLAIRREAYDGSDRRVADVEWCLAVGFEYAAAEKECSDPAPLRAKALMHYEACRASLAARRGRIAAAFDAGNAVQGDAAEADDLKEIVDELDETISACVERDAADAVNAVLPRAPATTVGFATPAARADDAAPVATLQAKKKRLRDAPAETGKPDRTKPFANNAH